MQSGLKCPVKQQRRLKKNPECFVESDDLLLPALRQSSSSRRRRAERQEAVYYIFHSDGQILVLADFTGTASLFRKPSSQLFSCHLNFVCPSNFDKSLGFWALFKKQLAKLCIIICWLVIGCQSAAQPLPQHIAGSLFFLHF